MKKLLIPFISLILIFSLISCEKQIPNVTDSTYEFEEDVCSGNNPKGCAHTPGPVSDATFVDVMFYTFEEHIDSATHILKGTFLATYCSDGYYEYKFKIDEQYKGTIDEPYVWVYYSPNTLYQTAIGEEKYVYGGISTPYKKGTSYILLLNKKVAVYYDHDFFLPGFGSCLKCDPKEPSFTMYGGEPIYEHSSADRSVFESVESLVKYIKERSATEGDGVKLEYEGVDYIRSTDLHNIVDLSPVVVKATVREVYSYAEDGEPIFYRCEVKRVFKGLDVGENILIHPLKGTVRKGGTYIFAIVENWHGEYVVTSKSSVIDIDQEKQIAAYSAY